ncbi:hypothetical protein PR048_001715, partial [Dryococelus australis]
MRQLKQKKLNKHNKILCPWASPLILTRDKLYKIYKKKRNNSNIKLELNELNNWLTMLKNSLIKEYHQNMFAGDGKIITQQQLIANTFCEHFTNVGVKISNQIQSYPSDDIRQLGTLETATDSIYLTPADEGE